MDRKAHEISERVFGAKFEDLGEREKRVAHHLAARTHIARNISKDLGDDRTLGQRMADKVASFGGSWTFIGIFATILVVWVGLNTFVLIGHDKAFDPYPYILLNLFLSMLAAIQAPIIMMSQNRQAYQDRENAEHDYEVNLKAELEIMELHEKVDMLKEKQWNELISIQQQQLRLLGEMLDDLRQNRPRAG